MSQEALQSEIVSPAIIRPTPPSFLISSANEGFYPMDGMAEFVRRIFFDEFSYFYNPAHSHLNYANIGYLWTNITNIKQQKRIAATAQIPKIQGSKWVKGIFDFQLKNWFGSVPLDFLIIFDAVLAFEMEDESFMATADHELYHCAQKLDDWGAPRFHQETGLPLYAIRDHDVTEFVGITERYGPDVSLNVPEMVAAAKKKPLFSASRIRAACGTCLGVRI